MRSTEFEKIQKKELINQDLIEIYKIISQRSDYILLLSLINKHRKIINKNKLDGKMRFKTLKYLEFFANDFKNDKARALSNFMCMLNNKGLLD